jgi:hypothetical protein
MTASRTIGVNGSEVFYREGGSGSAATLRWSARSWTVTWRSPLRREVRAASHYPGRTSGGRAEHPEMTPNVQCAREAKP